MQLNIYTAEANTFSEEKLSYLCELINKIYKKEEAGIWLESISRTSIKELQALIERKELIVAEFDQQIVGSISVKCFDQDRAEFGMLVADPNYRGKGIGKALIHFAEQYILSLNRKIMQFKLLVPLEWKHPVKEFLKGWYQDQGYIMDHYQPFDEVYHDQTMDLLTPCQFIYFQKKLKSTHRQHV